MSTESGQGWSLIRTPEEWDEYCREYELANNWESGNVHWGAVPAKYPCLVCTYSPNLYRVVSAFVYVTEATQLLAAAGMNVGRHPSFASDQERQAYTGDSGQFPESGQVVGGGLGNPDRPVRTQANFNRYVQANLLALWRTFSVLTGHAFDGEKAQDAVIEALSDVDRWSAADALERAKMDGNQILEKLDLGGQTS